MANNNKFAFSQPYNEIILNENLSLAAKVIYCVLKIHENKENHTCYPSIKTLSKEAGISENTVRKAINDLEKSRIIKIKRRKINKKEWESNLYLMQDLDFIKEKEPDTSQADQSNDVSSTNKNHICKDYNTVKQHESQVTTERWSMERIKQHYNYDILLDQKPYEKDTIDSYMDLLYDLLNEKSEYITISGNKIPSNIVYSRLEKLYYEHILYCIEQMNKQTTRIHSTKEYKKKLLYEAYNQMNDDIANKVQHDMHK